MTQSPLDPKDEEARRLVKEAISEWLDSMFATFGKWTLGGLVAAVLSGFVYIALIGAGWHK